MSQFLISIPTGFNLENSFARFLVYSTFLVNGNPITNLMSIGDATSATGQNPPKPATVAGLDTHNNCEGDTSMTRGMWSSAYDPGTFQLKNCISGRILWGQPLFQ